MFLNETENKTCKNTLHVKTGKCKSLLCSFTSIHSTNN